MVDTAAQIWRDYVTDGVPASGAHKPLKSAIRMWGADKEVRIAAIEATTQLAWLDPVVVSSTGNLTLSGEQTIDGVATSETDILVKDQTDGTLNGIYTTSSGAWARRADADTAGELASARVYVAGGDANADTAWLVSQTSIVLGTTDIDFIEVSASSGLLAAAEAAVVDASAAKDGAETARDAAEGYRDEAETARDAAFTNAGVYADTAAGLAAVANGEQFQVISGDESIRYRDDAGVATEVARYPTASGVHDAKRSLGLELSTKKLTCSAGSITPTCYQSYTPTNGVIYEIVAIVNSSALPVVNFISASGGLVYNVSIDLRIADANRITAPDNVTINYLGGDNYEIIIEETAVSGSASTIQMRPSPAGTFPFTAAGTEVVYVDSYLIRIKGTETNLWASDSVTAGSFTKTSLTAATATMPTSRLTEELSLAQSLADSLDVLINGQMIATRMTEASGAAIYPSCYRSVSFVSGETYTIKVPVKKGERTRCNLYCSVGYVFDGTYDLDAGTASGTGASIEPLGNGWYYAVMTGNAGATAAGNLQFRVFPASGAHPYAGDGTSGLYMRPIECWVDGINIFALYYDLTLSNWTKASLTPTANAALFVGLKEDVTALAYAETSHPLSGLKVTMVGTSLTGGTMPTEFETITGCEMQALSAAGGALGLDARGSPHYGSGDVTALFSSINADADVIILDGTPNDVAASDVPLGGITDTTTATYFGALANFIIWCEANRPNAAVAIVVTSPSSSSYSPSDYRHGVANANGNYLEEFQDAIRRACRYYGRPYIDPNVFGVGFVDSGDDTSDGLHWDASGALRVAKIYAAEAKRLAEAGWLDGP